LKSPYKKARVSYNTPFSFSGEGLRLALAQAHLLALMLGDSGGRRLHHRQALGSVMANLIFGRKS
jgi:hypothetical protein